jgi:hypothetical protein
VNASELYVFRLRNYQDLDTFLNEISGLVDRPTLMEMYKLATDEAFSFLYVRLTIRDKNKMFMIRYDKFIRVDD